MDIEASFRKIAESFGDKYEDRPQQRELAKHISRVIQLNGTLLAEAPCGVGKSLAYGIPAALYAVRDGKTAVIATANIALQEQLMQKDLPLIREKAGIDFQFSLVKGRGNYLCKASESSERSRGLLRRSEQERAILKWGETTTSGDMSELPFTPEAKTWRRFSSNSDECTGKKCYFYESCFSTRAARAAKGAHIVVTNHHMMLANIETHGNILPPHSVAIIDEAHVFADNARQFFGSRLSRGSFNVAAAAAAAVGKDDLANNIKDAARGLFDIVAESEAGRFKEPSPELAKACDLLVSLCSKAADIPSEDEHPVIELFKKQRPDNKLLEVIGEHQPTHVYFISHGKEPQHAAIESRLIEPGVMLRGFFMDDRQATIATSATMQAAGGFSYMMREYGIQDHEANTLAVTSPFPGNAARLRVSNLADEFDVAHRIEAFADKYDGRVLGLFTSYKMLNLATSILRGNGYELLVQGERPRTALVSEMRDGGKGKILLGTESFWAGIDLPGDCIKAIVIDKLPFPNMRDPVVQEIVDRDKEGNFYAYLLPRMSLMLRQGVGRLIRTANDTGEIWIGDDRLRTKAYGMAVLPLLPRIESEAA